MPYTTLLRWLRRGSGSGRRGRRRRPSVVLRLLVLEDRTLLSVFTVINLADGGPGSLRQAVLDANAQPGIDLINFAPGLQGTITLTSGQLSITDGLFVTGPGAGRLAVSGNDASRVFAVGSGVTAFLDGLTITHGQAQDGGGIYNAGTLTVSHITLSENQAFGSASGDARGGGIFNAPGAFLTVTDSALLNNQAVGRNGGPGQTGRDARGGGIYNLDATLTVSHSTLTGNQAVGGAGGAGAGGGGGAGGAITNDGVTGLASLTISQSTLSANQAVGGAGGRVGNNAVGGGIQNFGWTMLLLSNSTLSANAATGGAGRPGQDGGSSAGGGLSIFSTPAGPALITISSCTFTDNQATGGTGGAGANSGASNGGAIRIGTGGGPGGSVFISQSTFTGNQALGGAGGAGSNGGGGFGGAFQNSGPNWTITLSHSTFSGNQATGGAGGTGGNGGAGQGGCCFFGNLSTVFLEDVDITGNQATGGAAGASGRNGPGQGGGVYVNNGVVSARQTRITGNHASTSADDVFGPIDFGPIITTSPVVDFATRSIVFGESTVLRTAEGVTASLAVSGLEPGAYTFWMRVDAPGAPPAAGRLDGIVVGADGIGRFSGHVNVGDIVGDPSIPGLEGTLQDPLHATITLVVRSHGPASSDPERLFEQLHTFEPGVAFNFLISIHAPPP